MLITQARGRPLTAIAAAGAVAVAVFEVVQILQGQLYLRVLDHPDGTTLVMVCCLLLWGLAALKDRTDLQAVSVTWAAAVSCIFVYEALYKWSFHLAPFGRAMPAPELRAFVLQTAIAATVLVGFLSHHLSSSSCGKPMSSQKVQRLPRIDDNTHVDLFQARRCSRSPAVDVRLRPGPPGEPGDQAGPLSGLPQPLPPVRERNGAPDPRR